MAQLEAAGLPGRACKDHCLQYFVGLSAKSLGVAQMCPTVGLRRRWDGAARREMLDRLAHLEAQSPKVLTLLCEFCREMRSEARDYPGVQAQVPRLIGVCAGHGLYHLTLGLAHLAADISHWLTDEQREEVRAVLESCLGTNVMLNSAVLEALVRYTAVDVGVTEESALDQIRDLLQYPRTAESNEHASRIFDAQFEDIYQGAFFAAVAELEAEECTEFLVRAGLGASDSSFFAESIVRRLVESESTEALPVFERWTAPPSNPLIVSGDVGGLFVLAHLGLARLRATLPDPLAEIGSDRAAWREWGTILYWMYRDDCGADEVRARCARSWDRLSGELLTAAVDPWYWIELYCSDPWRGGETLVSAEGFFPLELRSVLQTGLVRLEELTSALGSHFHAAARTRMLMAALGRLGDGTAAVLLERWADSPEFGGDAIEAIRSIRQRE